MPLMRASTSACRGNLVFFLGDARPARGSAPNQMLTFVTQRSRRRRSASRMVGNCKDKGYPKKRSWWQKFFSDGDDESWFGWSAEDVLGVDGVGEDYGEKDGPADERFEAWKSRAEAIVELREAQETARNAEGRAWEDWLGGDELAGGGSSSSDQDWGGEAAGPPSEVDDDPEEIMRENGLVEAIKDAIAENDEELLFEDRVFRYASTSSVEIGKSPPLSDEDVWLELRHKAYHSESGWQALIEIILEHYGLEVDKAAITIFVCSVPVVIDACVKLWVGPISSF
ncbi:hypothetical protein BHE74_00041339 [Ensete ventricosum]|nr:hypothetical protein GW17_00005228 [Ensete ventricosum]RWW52247.1 hypothetical protein BHE74_00041339 [Ensete ventricosum]